MLIFQTFVFHPWTPVQQPRVVSYAQNNSTDSCRTACIALCLQPPAKTLLKHHRNEHLARGGVTNMPFVTSQPNVWNLPSEQ